MGRKLQRLSAKFVGNPGVPGYYADGGGLYLQVSDAGTKSWIFRFTLHGKAREMGLGSARTVSLAEARKKAGASRGLLLDKIDPIAVRDAEHVQRALERARLVTFSTCAERYIEAHQAAWKNAKHISQWENTIKTYCGPVIGELSVADVDTERVTRVLEPIWTTKRETASRLRGRIECVLDWATVRGYRMGDNPARWRGHLDKLLPVLKKKTRVKHHAALPYSEVGAFLDELRGQNGIAALALEFTILTAARTGEVIGARPEEFDLEKTIWTVPASRMKAEREHRVPLSGRAAEIVRRQIERAGEFVFSGRKPAKPLSNMSMLMLLKRMRREDLTVHGFRSTFRDWAAECTNYPREVAEMALAHVVSDQTEAAYRRGDLFEKRRLLMIEWARHCDKRPNEVLVLPIRKAG